MFSHVYAETTGAPSPATSSPAPFDWDPIARYCHKLGLKRFTLKGIPIERAYTRTHDPLSMQRALTFKDQCLEKGYRENPPTGAPQTPALDQK
jgi:hypothetical protein